MPRLLIGAGVVVVVALIYALVDLAMIDRSRVRGVGKPLWALIILIPVLGVILWFTIGRGRLSPRPAGRPLAPDDDPAFLGRIDPESDERIRRLEQELAELDDLDDFDDEPPASRG